MSTRLLNAAVMPCAGTYTIHSVTPTLFAEYVRELDPVSYIGYPECARLLSELCGRPIALNRESTPVEDGDTLLIARLRYRVGNPAAKGFVVATVADYEFFVGSYIAP